MPINADRFRRLVALDENDPLSRFALGQALLQEDSDDVLEEAAEHLRFANQKAPEHLATYHVLGKVLVKLGRTEEARSVLTAGCAKVDAAGGGMGRDLGPVLAEMLGTL